MKIAQLEYFCAVCEYHSITQASQKLYVTQPAISNAIRELEKEFSVSLFTRTKNHMALTEEGERFYQKASELLETIKQTSSELYDLGRQTLPIRIGIPPILSTIFFPDMLMGFQEEYPGVPVELYEYGSIRAARLVEQESLDLALVNLNFCETGKLNAHQLLSDKIVFCVSPDHPLAAEKEIGVEQLKEEKVILYNTDSVLNSTLYSLFERAGIKPNVIMHASQLHTIRSFVVSRLGGAFLYASCLKNFPGLAGIPVAPAVRQEIGMVWKKGKYLNSGVEKYIAYTRRFRLHS